MVRAKVGADMENFMKVMNLVGISMVGAMSLALSGCGGGSGSGAQPNPYATPYGGYPYNQQQMNQQPYTCQAGVIQLRNAFGNPQCYSTTVLAEACAQAGGVMTVNGAACRKEREISGRPIIRTYFSLFGNHSSVRIPMSAQLYAGEALKVHGSVDRASEWDAQLMQNGVVVGSASSRSGVYSEGSDDLVITALSSGVQPYYQNTYYPQGQVPTTTPYPGYSYPNPTQYPYAGQSQYGYGNQGTLQSFSLEVMFRGSLEVRLYGSAVSCEDGRGNSYPCQ